MRFARTLPSLLLLATFLLFAVAPGCGAEPVNPSGDTLRRSFPEHAARVLEAGSALAASGDGYGLAEPTAGAGSWGDLGIVLPHDGADGVRFKGDAGFEIRVREHGVEGSGALADRAMAYARPGGTSFWSAGPGGFEEWLHLQAGSVRDGQAVAVWDIEGGTLREEGDAVAILDGTGKARLFVRAPSAFARGGRALAPRLAVRGSTIEIFVDAGGDEVLVDPSWTPAGSLSAPRAHFCGATAGNGNVVVAGGQAAGGAVIASAERYVPATGLWSSAGSISTGREWLTATWIPSISRALVAGGQSTSASLTNADLYDAVANTWAPAGFMKFPRATHAAVLLTTGNVMVVGGASAGEIYDPITNLWTPTTSNVSQRSWASAAPLPGGKAMVAGGSGFATVEIYNPLTNGWTLLPSMSTSRLWFTLTLLGNGKVLAAGGEVTFGGAVLSSAEVYDPTLNTWTLTPPMSVGRAEHTATVLPNGKVLVAGGYNQASSELYDPATNTWIPTASMSGARASHNAALLQNGNVLVSAGVGAGLLTTAEIYSSANGTPCAVNGECGSGFCADGFCCNSACKGLCQACSAAKNGGVNGTCGNVAVATDPDNECAAQPQSTCGTSGACDGAGACQLFASGLTCAPASCSGSTLNNASTCNGTGTCVLGGSQSCGAYLCVGATCPTSCTLKTDCTLGNVCIGSKCVAPLLPDGSPCKAAGQCNSANCVDSVCCNTACSAGACDACSVATGALQDGVCALLSGTACDDGDACTQADTCSAGACLPGSPLQCAAIDMCHTAGVCDSAMGGCTNPVAVDGTSCVDKNGCTQNDTCQSGKCVGGPVCPPPADGCQVGGCNALGLCDYVPVADGTTCSDGASCTVNDVCMAGACAGKVACPAIDKCHLDGVCVSGTGACTDGGMNTPECTVDPECETLVLACDVASGKCSKTTKPDGTPCGGTGECVAGTCSGGMGTGSASGGSASTGAGGSGTGSASTGSAGTASAGSAGTASTGVGGGNSGATSGGGGNSGDGTVAPAGGCGCSTVGTSESRAPWLLLGLLLAAKRRRRVRLA